MLGRRRRQRRSSLAGPTVWNIPVEFNFTRDVVEALARDRDRRALTFVDREGIVTRHTFADMAREASRWAGLLRAHRLEPGALLLAATGKTPAWPAVVLGALKAGLVFSPVEPTVSSDELARRVRLTGAALLVATAEAAPQIEATRNDLERPLGVVYVDESGALLRDQPTSAPTHPTIPRDAALILPSSGTTGEPRLVRHTHAHIWAQRLAAEHWLGAAEGELVWCTAGAGSATAVWHALLGPWSRGAEVILHEGDFDADERLNLIEQLHVSVLCQTPEEYRLLAELEGIEGCDLRGLRQAVSVGERTDPKAAARWLAAFGVVLRDGYAQTETGLVLGNLIGSVANAGAVGVSLPGHDMAVVGGGEELAAGDEGELAVRGRPPSLFGGYAGDSTTPPGFKGDWYLTGDRAVRDEAGLFWLTGRSEDSIAAPGATVGALEVEAALLRHSAVADAAAVQAGGGERRGAKAFVVPTPRAELGDELADALREHARHAAGVRAVPAEIEFVAALPRTAAWKLNRVELRRGEHARPADPVEAAWPEPARLVVPQPRTLEFEPEPRNLEPEPEPEPQPDVADPVELHAASEPEPHSRAEPEPKPEAEPEPKAEPEPEAEPEPVRDAAPERAPDQEPAPEPAPQPQKPAAPTADGGLAARLAAYGLGPSHAEEDENDA